MESNERENGNNSPSSTGNVSQKIKQLVTNPIQTRDTKANDDSDKSDDESNQEITHGDKIIEAVKEENKIKKQREKHKKRQPLDDLEEEDKFSFFDTLGYIERNLTGLWFYTAVFAYAVVGCLLIMLPPTLVILLERPGMPKLLMPITQYKGVTSSQINFKLGVFFCAVFLSYLVIYLIMNRLVFIVAMVCDVFNHKINNDGKIILFIVDDIKDLITVLIVSIFGIIHCNLFMEDYSLTRMEVKGYGRLGGYSMCAGILFFFFIVEKFFLKLAIAYCGNNVFSGRIGDVNFKTSILRRLSIYAQSISQRGMGSMNADSMEGIEITNTFLVHFADFKIKSKSQCEDIVYEILNSIAADGSNTENSDPNKPDAHLKMQITIDSIRDAFGNQWMEIWRYLEAHEYVKEVDGNSVIRGKDLLNLAISVYGERIDLKRTLYDRDKILGILDTILQIVAIILTLMISTPFIGFNPINALAGFVPLLMSSGWLFSDIIKDVFNNFIFLLHEHAFDVGDKILVQSKEFTVLRIDLMYSTFTSKGGTVCYIPNKELIKESIFNVRRSDIQTELVVFIIKDEVTIDKLNEIKEKIVNILKSKEQDSKKRISIQDYETKSDTTVVTFRIEYLCNFRDPEPKFTRRHLPLEIIQKALVSAGCSYAEQKAESTV
ncbi:hypothetical protein NEIRO03_0534 [Nematocida sp. AWRm78]|nr:hypothetical protein NEIRO02_1186 [Nematocida sp. AWRm79]KAI5182894.1 hypothetical protein NEIRO03_0534 [Nematocida sp. AWRm78]